MMRTITAPWCLLLLFLALSARGATGKQKLASRVEEMGMEIRQLAIASTRHEDKLRNLEETSSKKTGAKLKKLAEENKKMQEDIEALKRANPVHPVFYVSMETETVSDSRIRYDVITTNVGEGYKPETGIFVCPISGFYQFTFTTSTAVDIFHMNKVVEDVVMSQAEGGLTTGVAVLRCDAGGHVWVESRAGSCDSSAVTPRRETLVGVMLAPDDDNHRF